MYLKAVHLNITLMPARKDSNKPSISLRIVVLGSSGVGKSALVMQYVRGVFVESYDPTLEDSFSKEVKISGQPIDVEILDTAGTDQFAAMRDMYIGTGDAFLIVYAVDSKASFNEACALFNRIRAIRNKKFSAIIIGNKSDLSTKCRRVSYEQGVHFSHQNRCPFMEVSARRNEGTNVAFETLLKLALTSSSTNNPIAHRNNSGNSDENKRKKDGHHDCIIS